MDTRLRLVYYCHLDSYKHTTDREVVYLVLDAKWLNEEADTGTIVKYVLESLYERTD